MNLPNYLTLIRILLVPLFLTTLIYYKPDHPELRTLALILFLVGALTDALDGFLARRLHLETRLGTFLDPFADKLLLLSGFLGIAASKSFPIEPPLWVIVVVVFRDLMIVSGLLIIFLNTGTINIRPNLLGKITTFLQMITILSLLLAWEKSAWIWTLMIVFTALSGISYLVRGMKILNSSSKTA